MKLKLALTLILTVAFATHASATDKATLKEWFTPLSTAMTGAGLCDFEIDYVEAGVYLQSKSNGAAFSSGEVAYAMWWAVMMPTLIFSLGGAPRTKPEKTKFCGEKLRDFGPNGSIIPRILKP
jgi:hypothetical protein